MPGINRRHFLSAAGALAVMPAAATAGSAGLSADLPILRRAYGLLHPGLYRYQSPAQWTDRLDAAMRALDKPANLAQQYVHLARLAAGLKCGHSYANFFNQSKPVVQQLFAPANKLPFLFIWIGNRMIVTANPLAIEGLRRGSEILAIDGVSAADIQARLMPLVRADGSNDAKRRKLLEVEGKNGVETFDSLYPMLFPVGGTFTLRVRQSPGAPARTLTVSPIDQAARERQAPATSDPGTPDYWRLDFPAPKVACLTMPGWGLYNQTWDWRGRIAAIFAAIAERGADGLIIDIRDNEGGLDCGHEIIARLIDTDLPLNDTYERRVRFRTTPEDLRPYLDTWDRSFDTLGEGAEDIGNGWFRLSPPDGVGVITPRGPRFTGKVIVLSSPENSSATFQFISLMRTHGLARIYGGPTGGNQRGINGGAFFFLRLPHSGLEVDLPLIGTFPKEPLPDAGLLPDVHIEAAIEDIAAGRDPVLARAIADLG